MRQDVLHQDRVEHSCQQILLEGLVAVRIHYGERAGAEVLHESPALLSGMEFQELRERQREDPELHEAPGQVRGELGRKEIRVGSGDVYVGIGIDLKRVDGLLPRPDPLDLVQEDVDATDGLDGRDVVQKIGMRHDMLPCPRLEVHVDYVIFRDSGSDQSPDELPHQHGLSAAPHPGDDLHHVRPVSSGFQSLQIRASDDFWHYCQKVVLR